MTDIKPTAPSSLHVVYCLTSSGGDLYEAMTCVSLATVRLTNPTARIEIACDQQTHQALHAIGSQLLREADAVHGFPTPDGPPTFRNRFVKTQLRLLLSGPFLFLDSDTVVRKPLTPLLNLQADIAAAPNHSADTLAEQIWSEDQANLDTMGWQVREPYVNGGVIWYADTPAAHRFAESWHHNWLANVERTGRYRDQPALNYSVWSSGCNFLRLNHSWNSQVYKRSDLSETAIIWHLYSSDQDACDFAFYVLSRALLSARKSPLQMCEALDIVNAKSPFITRSPSSPQYKTNASMSDNSIGLVLPTGLALGGVTTWALGLASRLDSRKVRTKLLCHQNLKEDFCRSPDLEILIHQIQGRCAWNCRMADVKRFAKAYKRSNVNVLIPNFSWGAYAAAALMSQDPKSEVLIIGVVHTDSEHIYSLLYYYAPVIAKFIAVSSETLDKLHELLPDRSADFVHLPYPIAISDSYRENRPSNRPLRLIYAGRLEQEQKRILDLIELVKALKSLPYKYEISIAGDGPCRKEIEDFTQAESNFDTNVHCSYLGSVNISDMPSLWRDHDVCILFSEYEGVSISMTEAMAEGCVPVVTRVSGTSDVIKEGMNGFTYPVGDINAMVDILNSLSRHPSILQTLSHTCIDYILQHRDPSEYDAKFLELLASAKQEPKRVWPRSKPLGPPEYFSHETLATDFIKSVRGFLTATKRLMRTCTMLFV